MLSRSQLDKLAEALGGVPVWGCLPGSSAQRAGLRYGDVLLSANGQRTRSAVDYADAKALRRDGITLRVFRDGQEREVELLFDASSPQPATREQLEAMALEVAAARLLPLDRPPREPDGGS